MTKTSSNIFYHCFLYIYFFQILKREMVFRQTTLQLSYLYLNDVTLITLKQDQCYRNRVTSEFLFNIEIHFLISLLLRCLSFYILNVLSIKYLCKSKNRNAKFSAFLIMSNVVILVLYNLHAVDLNTFHSFWHVFEL